MSAGKKIFRICFTGSECTGKTTLTEGLAKHWDVIHVPEYARRYAAARGGVLGARDVGPIAEGQLAAEAQGVREAEERARSGSRPLLLLDTDLISTVVYARFYYGGCPPWIEHAARARRAELYFLCGIDVPWCADGMRDLAHAREEIHQLFRSVLKEFGASPVEIQGSMAHRLAFCQEHSQANAIVKNL